MDKPERRANDIGYVHQVQEREHHQYQPIGHDKEHVAQSQQQFHQPGLGHSVEPESEHVTIFIDHQPYKIAHSMISGAELRRLPVPPIDAATDIFHVIRGNSEDVKINDTDVIEINWHDAEHGRHFYSASKKSSLAAAKKSRQEVEQKAYAIYVSNGCQHGHDVEHWVEAEAQLSKSQH